MLQVLRSLRAPACVVCAKSILQHTVAGNASLPKTLPIARPTFRSFAATGQGTRSHRMSTQASPGRGGTTGGAGGGGGGGDGGGGGGRGGWGPLGLWAAYLRLLESQPVFTKAWSAGLLNGVGDICSQKLIEHRAQTDWKRLGIFTLLGAVMVGPALHHWYLTLSRTVTTPGTSGTLIRLGLDQFVFAPIFIAGFMTILLTIQGQASEISPKLQQDWPAIVITNWKIWIPFQFFNFGFVPQHLQVLASNVVAVAWNTYLSHASHANLDHA